MGKKIICISLLGDYNWEIIFKIFIMHMLEDF